MNFSECENSSGRRSTLWELGKVCHVTSTGKCHFIIAEYQILIHIVRTVYHNQIDFCLPDLASSGRRLRSCRRPSRGPGRRLRRACEPSWPAATPRTAAESSSDCMSATCSAVKDEWEFQNTEQRLKNLTSNISIKRGTFFRESYYVGSIPWNPEASARATPFRPRWSK